MTIKEKLAVEHPEDAEKIISEHCPDMYRYPSFPGDCTESGNCKKCWEREIPETKSLHSNDKYTESCCNYESEYERIKQMYEELYDKYRNMEECAKYWENEAECRGECIEKLRIENAKLEAIIRTVEVLTGGRLLDD